MRTIFLSIFLVFVHQTNIAGHNFEHSIIPPLTIFHDIGTNVLCSITHNYGMNLITAGIGTWTLIETGLDWRYNRIAYNNRVLAYTGFPSLYIGYFMPVILPASLYLFGIDRGDKKLQIAGLAAAQATIISIGFTSVIKGMTGRISPGIIDVLDHRRSFYLADYSSDFEWGFGKRGFIAGYPSTHTTIAFATAAVLSEIYHDSLLVKAISYSYAAFIGIGVSLCVH